MIKPFAIITIRKEPFYRRNAVESGLKRLGYRLATETRGASSPSSPDDLLVLWNKKRGQEEEWAHLWERQGGTVIIMENGYLQKVDKTMYALSTHGHNGSGWFPTSDEDRFSRLGFELKPWRTDGAYSLVCGQRGIGSSLMASPPQWAERTAAKLMAAKKDIAVKLRLHPGNHAPKVPLLHDLRGARDCYVWSSASGVLALVEGVPVLHAAPHWICEGWGKDRETAREVALNHMAHGQWSVAEIEAGEPFAHMRELDWGPRWV